MQSWMCFHSARQYILQLLGLSEAIECAYLGMEIYKGAILRVIYSCGMPSCGTALL